MDRAGVLSDADIRAELSTDPPIIQNFSEANLQGDAYDLRVGHIITAREYVHYDGEQGRDIQGRRRDSILLKPGESATLATIEAISLPQNI